MLKYNKILYAVFFILLFVAAGEIGYYFYLKPTPAASSNAPTVLLGKEEPRTLNLIGGLINPKTKILNGVMVLDNLDSEEYQGNIIAAPIIINVPFRVRVKFRKEIAGPVHLTLSGRLPVKGKQWWEEIHTLFIGDAGDKIFLELRDGRSPEAWSKTLDKLAQGAVFYLEFFDTSGKKFSLVDSAGSVLETIDVTKLDKVKFPQGLFPEGKLWSGFLVAPKAKLVVDEFVLSFTGK